jgi:hypothetical protein
MERVSESVATAEVNKWLDYKRISAADREDFKDHIKSLISGVMEGTVRINEENFHIEIDLNWPVDSGVGPEISKLSLKPRIQAREISDRLEKMKIAAGNADGRLKAILCALSGQSSGVIGMLDTTDLRMCNNVVIFFI